jgi:RNA polymerase sigma-70 factor (ECF subfamily)
MTLVSRDDPGPASVSTDLDHDPEDWVAALSTEGPGRDVALRRLHAALLRAARHQIWRMRPMLNGAGPVLVDELAYQAADEALVALPGKLSTFEGRSRFTTWAYKFAILQAATEVRGQAWRSRQVLLEDSRATVDLGPSVEQYAEGADLAREVDRAIHLSLTPHQRRVMVALLVDEVPIDVPRRTAGH